MLGRWNKQESELSDIHTIASHAWSSSPRPFLYQSAWWPNYLSHLTWWSIEIRRPTICATLLPARRDLLPHSKVGLFHFTPEVCMVGSSICVPTTNVEMS